MARKKGKEKSDAEKTADFKRIAAKKANTIARNASQLASMAGSSRYLYSPEQLKKLQAYVNDAVENCFAAFAGKKSAASGIEL